MLAVSLPVSSRGLLSSIARSSAQTALAAKIEGADLAAAEVKLTGILITLSNHLAPRSSVVCGPWLAGIPEPVGRGMPLRGWRLLVSRVFHVCNSAILSVSVYECLLRDCFGGRWWRDDIG